MTTILWHVIRRLLFASLVAVSAISVPISLVFIFHNTPVSILYSKNVWMVVYGVLPLVVYSAALPIGFAIAVTWCYDNLVSDHEVEALYAAGCSYFKLITPAIAVGVLGAALGLLLSCVVAPDAAKRLVDLSFEAEHNLRPSLLDEQKFYVYNGYNAGDDQYTIYFDHRADKENVSGVFLREVSRGGTEKIVTGETAQFIEGEQESYLHVFDGVGQWRNRGESQPRIVHFDDLWLSTGLRGSLPLRRDWASACELGPVEFFTVLKDMSVKSIKDWDWASEALKRFGAPLLMIPYALIGITITLRGAGIRRDTWWRLQAISLLFVINHGAILMATLLPHFDMRLTWVVAFLIVLEVCGGLALPYFAISIPTGERRKLIPDGLPTQITAALAIVIPAKLKRSAGAMRGGAG